MSLTLSWWVVFRSTNSSSWTLKVDWTCGSVLSLTVNCSSAMYSSVGGCIGSQPDGYLWFATSKCGSSKWEMHHCITAVKLPLEKKKKKIPTREEELFSVLLKSWTLTWNLFNFFLTVSLVSPCPLSNLTSSSSASKSPLWSSSRLAASCYWHIHCLSSVHLSLTSLAWEKTYWDNAHGLVYFWLL